MLRERLPFPNTGLIFRSRLTGKPWQNPLIIRKIASALVRPLFVSNFVHPAIRLTAFR